MARRKEYRESKKMGRNYDYAESGVAKTITSDWSMGQEGAMMQYDNGSMKYYERKGKLDSEDTKKISRSGLPQM